MASCPACGGERADTVRHVAWGGVVAPRLYRLVRCAACGSRFSARTGRPERELVRGYLRGVLAATLLASAGIAVAWWVVA
jgi:hypothetical protein